MKFDESDVINAMYTNNSVIRRMTIDDYMNWRKSVLFDADSFPKIETRRGMCSVVSNFIIFDNVDKNRHMLNTQIEDAEFNLIYYGKEQSPKIKEQLYKDDDEMYNAYLNLRICRFKNAITSSRNNVICEPKCCMNYWQLYLDTLFVVSRSLDLRCAGISDIIVANRIAAELGAQKLHIVAIAPHIYTDRKNIARRKK